MANYYAAATDAQGRLTAPSVLSQIDARTKATMRADLPALAKELNIGGGSGIEQVSGTITLDSTGAPIREFYTTGAATFKANGADTLISSFTAVVWRRNAQGSWGYQVVQDGWVTPAATPDTTAPVAGILGVTVTDVKADLSVSGASDDRGYVQYSFSKDNGANWTAYQDAATYTFTGLTASTAYTFRHRVKDAAGNVTTGTAVSKATESAPSALAAAITSLSPAGYWKLNDKSGSVATDSSGHARHGSYDGTYTTTDGYATGSGVSIPDHDAFSPATASDGFTVFAMFRPGTLSPRGYIAAKGASSQYEWWLDSVSGGLRFTASTLAGNPLIEYASTTAVLTTGAWQAVAATISQPASGGVAELFRNSATPLASTRTNPASGSSENGTAPVTIGRRSDSSWTWGQTALGHVAIFRKKLTATEVGALMAAARKDGLIV